MKIHANAKLTPRTRELLCRRVTEEGWTVRAAAEAAGVSERRAYVYLARLRDEGPAGLADRSSTPHTVANRTPPDRVAVVESLRRLRLTGTEIAARLSMASSTVTELLRRLGLNRLSRLGGRSRRTVTSAGTRASSCMST